MIVLTENGYMFYGPEHYFRMKLGFVISELDVITPEQVNVFAKWIADEIPFGHTSPIDVGILEHSTFYIPKDIGGDVWKISPLNITLLSGTRADRIIESMNEWLGNEARAEVEDEPEVIDLTFNQAPFTPCSGLCNICCNNFYNIPDVVDLTSEDDSMEKEDVFRRAVKMVCCRQILCLGCSLQNRNCPFCRTVQL
jgi:hypothetical protein